MFNKTEIVTEEVARLQRHYNHVGNALYFGHMPAPILPGDDTPFGKEIELLCDVANGKINRATADEFAVMEIAMTVQSVCEALFVAPGGTYAYIIPEQFWNTQLGQVVARVQMWLRDDDLISITEAAKMLRNGTEKRDLMYVRSLIKSGQLTAYPDLDEPNPTQRQRVSRAAVEALKK